MHEELMCGFSTCNEHDPRGNGAMEVQWRILANDTRAALHMSTLPRNYAGYAALDCVRKSWILPSSNAGADTTPWELFTGERALVSSMRPFGCLCYPRKIDPITKMSDQSMRCIMLPVITKMSDQSMRCIMLPVTRLRLGSGNLLLGAARERLLNA